MKGTLWIMAVGVVCVLVAVPAAAADPDGVACQTPGSTVQTASQDPVLMARGDVVGPGELGVCNAQCWDGSYVTCWGTSCQADDSNCSINFRGRCYGTSTGYRYCPRCEGPCTQTVTASCQGGPPVSCTGSCEGSFAFDDCYAYCDGTLHYCVPPPKYACPEPL